MNDEFLGVTNKLEPLRSHQTAHSMLSSTCSALMALAIYVQYIDGSCYKCLAMSRKNQNIFYFCKMENIISLSQNMGFWAARAHQNRDLLF